MVYLEETAGGGAGGEGRGVGARGEVREDGRKTRWKKVRLQREREEWEARQGKGGGGVVLREERPGEGTDGGEVGEGDERKEAGEPPETEDMHAGEGGMVERKDEGEEEGDEGTDADEEGEDMAHTASAPVKAEVASPAPTLSREAKGTG